MRTLSPRIRPGRAVLAVPCPGTAGRPAPGADPRVSATRLVLGAPAEEARFDLVDAERQDVERDSVDGPGGAAAGRERLGEVADLDPDARGRGQDRWDAFRTKDMSTAFWKGMGASITFVVRKIFWTSWYCRSSTRRSQSKMPL